jgi:hypothetical protein
MSVSVVLYLFSDAVTHAEGPTYSSALTTTTSAPPPPSGASGSGALVSSNPLQARLLRNKNHCRVMALDTALLKPNRFAEVLIPPHPVEYGTSTYPLRTVLHSTSHSFFV